MRGTTGARWTTTSTVAETVTGRVPPKGWVELVRCFVRNDSRAGEAADVSSDGGVWSCTG